MIKSSMTVCLHKIMQGV